jgi:hypothetical protein
LGEDIFGQKAECPSRRTFSVLRVPTSYVDSRLLHTPAGILWIPAFSVPIACFAQESRFLFRHNLVFRNKRSKNLRSKTRIPIYHLAVSLRPNIQPAWKQQQQHLAGNVVSVVSSQAFICRHGVSCRRHVGDMSLVMLPTQENVVSARGSKRHDIGIPPIRTPSPAFLCVPMHTRPCAHVHPIFIFVA